MNIHVDVWNESKKWKCQWILGNVEWIIGKEDDSVKSRVSRGKQRRYFSSSFFWEEFFYFYIGKEKFFKQRRIEDAKKDFPLKSIGKNAFPNPSCVI